MQKSSQNKDFTPYRSLTQLQASFVTTPSVTNAITLLLSLNLHFDPTGSLILLQINFYRLVR